MSACKGSGFQPLKKDCWNIRNKKAAWGGEGWRTECPECGKISAVGPTSKAIQKHYPAKSKAKKMSALEAKIAKQAIRDLLYAEIYEVGLTGESMRPTGLKHDLREVWEMAYLDGLADGGHTMKIGAFKRWLAKNAS